jgi:hypothetical protein
MTGKLWLCKVVGRAEPDPSIDTRKPYILQPLAEIQLNAEAEHGDTTPAGDTGGSGGDSEM